jgi:hypothetical protein
MPEGLFYVKKDVQSRMNVFIVPVKMGAQAGTIPGGGENVNSMPE